MIKRVKLKRTVAYAQVRNSPKAPASARTKTKHPDMAAAHTKWPHAGVTGQPPVQTFEMTSVPAHCRSVPGCAPHTYIPAGLGTYRA